jgi:hypothetical protein
MGRSSHRKNRLGALDPRYAFILNQSTGARFGRQCSRTRSVSVPFGFATEQRRHPFYERPSEFFAAVSEFLADERWPPTAATTPG